MVKNIIYDTDIYPKTLLLGVYAPYNKTQNVESYFEEFVNLAKTNNVRNYETLFIKTRDVDSSYFLTKGKLEELKKYCDEHEIEQLIISESLTPQQERNLSDFIDCPIYDRTQLILEIFEKSAHSAEGKMQVHIAMLQHQKTRLAGQGVDMMQQRGVRGMRGGYGETRKEKDRRHIETTILKLNKQLEMLDRTRETQRKQRLTTGITHICIIGYTNAGKSTLLNTLTNSSVLAEDKLFATLDTTTRELYINKSKVGLISDTVGFIQQLPHKLIAAFKSTLSELQHADLLVHVVDLSDLNWETHIQVVHNILDELEVKKDMIYVFNKVDKVASLENLTGALSKYQPHALTNAQTKEGLKPLIEYLNTWSLAKKAQLTPLQD